MTSSCFGHRSAGILRPPFLETQGKSWSSLGFHWLPVMESLVEFPLIDSSLWEHQTCQWWDVRPKYMEWIWNGMLDHVWSIPNHTPLSSIIFSPDTLWWTNILPWKDPPFLMGKSTISTGPFSIAMLVHQRVSHLEYPFSSYSGSNPFLHQKVRIPPFWPTSR